MGPDPKSLLASPQPVAQLFFNAMGRGPAIFFTLAGFAVMNLVAIPGLQSGSRTVFAFARDDLVPLSRVWRRMWTRTGTPVAAVWVYAAAVVVVNLLGLVSDTAIAAVFNVCAVALNVGYLVPIVCKMVYGRFERGPWHLGRWYVDQSWTVFSSSPLLFMHVSGVKWLLGQRLALELPPTYPEMELDN
jgi:amino acid transporter